MDAVGQVTQVGPDQSINGSIGLQARREISTGMSGNNIERIVCQRVVWALVIWDPAVLPGYGRTSGGSQHLKPGLETRT